MGSLFKHIYECKIKTLNNCELCNSKIKIYYCGPESEEELEQVRVKQALLLIPEQSPQIIMLDSLICDDQKFHLKIKDFIGNNKDYAILSEYDDEGINLTMQIGKDNENKYNYWASYYYNYLKGPHHLPNMNREINGSCLIYNEGKTNNYNIDDNLINKIENTIKQKKLNPNQVLKDKEDDENLYNKWLAFLILQQKKVVFVEKSI